MVSVAEVPSPDASPPLKVAPQLLEPTPAARVTGAGVNVTSKETSTAALVGAGGVDRQRLAR
jgi:hypothetical protein